MKTAKTKSKKKKKKKKKEQKTKTKNNEYISGYNMYLCSFWYIFLSLSTISIITMFLVFIVIYAKERINKNKTKISEKHTCI